MRVASTTGIWIASKIGRGRKRKRSDDGQWRRSVPMEKERRQRRIAPDHRRRRFSKIERANRRSRVSDGSVQRTTMEKGAPSRKDCSELSTMAFSNRQGALKGKAFVDAAFRMEK